MSEQSPRKQSPTNPPQILHEAVVVTEPKPLAEASSSSNHHPRTLPQKRTMQQNNIWQFPVVLAPPGTMVYRPPGYTGSTPIPREDMEAWERSQRMEAEDRKKREAELDERLNQEDEAVATASDISDTPTLNTDTSSEPHV